MSASRLLRALQALIRQTLPEVPYQSLYRYRVVSQASDGRVTLQAVRKLAGMPDARALSVLHGAPGVSSRLRLGSLVLVQFIEGDPAQPIVTHFEAEGGPGWRPISLLLDASEELRIGKTVSAVIVGPDDPPPLPVARKTDPVAIGQLTVAGVGGVTLQFTPAGGTPGPAGPTVTLSGEVEDGSPLLSSG
jgi:hypothetical protein